MGDILYHLKPHFLIGTMLRHLYVATSPIMTLSIMLGTISFVLKTNKQEKTFLKTVATLKMIPAVYLFVYTFSVADLIITPLKHNNIGNHMSTVMSYIGLLFTIISHIVCTYFIYIFNFIKSESIKNTFEEIATADAIIKRIGKNINYKSYVKYQLICLFIGIISIIFVITEQFMYIKKSGMFSITYSFCIVYYFPMILIFMIEMQFAMLVLLIYDRLLIINENLLDISTFKGAVWNSSYKISPRNNISLVFKANEYAMNQTIKKIDELMKLNDSLNDIAHHVNVNYHMQILPIIATQFIVAVFSIFYAYYSIVIISQKIVALRWIIWALLTCSEILLITIPCHFTTKAAKTTGVCVHKVLMNSLEALIKEKLFVFSQQVYQRKLHFTACGLFNIDATLLFTIGGSAATYLLIMLQFQEGNDANCITKIISKNITT